MFVSLQLSSATLLISLGTSNTAEVLAIVASPKHLLLSRWTTKVPFQKVLIRLPCTKKTPTKNKQKNPSPCIVFSDITGEIVKDPIRTQNYRIPSGKYT